MSRQGVVASRVAFGLLILPGPLAAQSTQAPPADWLETCEVDTAGGTADAWCGSYEVWENRTTREGRRIGLEVVVLPAREEPREPDAVVWLHGGPGGAATETIGGMSAALAESWRHRDLLFVDQRGTGGSNPLDCPTPDEDGPLQAFFDALLDPDRVRECLEGVDADVTQYTTPIAMDDLDEVRGALGYERINLFGGSYGTRAGLIYLRRHPERVRSAVLKGVAPTDMRNPLPFARALEWGLDGVLEACAAEAACAEAYPDLEGDWDRVVKRFRTGPATATVEHHGRSEQVTISQGVFADGVRHILYSVGASAELPRIIHDAARGDFDHFAQEELQQVLAFGEALSMGMFMTVTCSEDLPFVTEDEIRRETSGTFLGDYRVRRQLAACEVWGRGEISPDYPEPVRAAVPTLLISGEYDTATPVEGAARVAESLPLSTHVIIPNQSHGFANPACEFGLINAFIARGGPDRLDTACVARTRRPAFDTREAGR